MAPATVTVLKPATQSSLQTFTFDSYNEALTFQRKSAPLNPSKPYKQIKGAGAPVWCVTVVNRSVMQAKPVTLTIQAALHFDWKHRMAA